MEHILRPARSAVLAITAAAVAIAGCSTNNPPTVTDITRAPNPAATLQSAPSPISADRLCSIVHDEPFEVRDLAVESATAPVLAASSSQCTADLDRYLEARALLDRTDTVALALPSITCDGDGYTVTFANASNETVGGVFAIYDGEQASSFLAEPLIVWQIEPGESREIVGTWPVGAPLTADPCVVRGRYFLADRSPADGSNPGGASDQVTGDDPVAWLPGLIEMERDLRSDGTIGSVSRFEDIRSLAFTSLVASTVRTNPTTMADIDVCADAVRYDGDDHAMVLYQRSLDDGGHDLISGVFRRGSDEQWRWLATAVTLSSGPERSCADVAVLGG